MAQEQTPATPKLTPEEAEIVIRAIRDVEQEEADEEAHEEAGNGQ